MKVSILMPAYNHEAFIERAVASVLAQSGNVDFELVVAEDCSTDATRDILRGLAEKAGGRIRLLQRQANLGGSRNFADAYRSCRGEYIALLEGDDYWTDPQKLAKQVAALEANPHWSLCFHRAATVDERDRPCGAPFPRRVPRETSIEDILRANYVPTCSIVLRRRAVPVLPSWWCETQIGDWPLCILASENGALGFLPEVMACYRLHGKSSFSSVLRLAQYERSVAMASLLRRHLGHRHERQVRSLEVRLRLGLAKEAARTGRRDEARSAFLAALELAFPTQASGDTKGERWLLRRCIEALPIQVAVFLLLSLFGLEQRVAQRNRSAASDFQPRE